MSQSDHEGPTCICGQQVAAYHKECLALLTPQERRNLKETGRIWRAN